MANYTFVDDEQISFTGTSVGTNNVGPFVALGSVDVPNYSHMDGPLHVELSGFNFDYSSTAWAVMGMDLTLMINGVAQSSFQRFPPESKWNPSLLHFAGDFAVPAGQVDVKIGIRSVLFSGPPIPIRFWGTVTLSLLDKAGSLIVSPAGPLGLSAGNSAYVTVSLPKAEPVPVTISLSGENGFVSVTPPSATIPPGSLSAGFTVLATVGGNELLMASATGFTTPPMLIGIQPVLSAINPSRGPAGTKVELIGKGFGNGAGASVIWGNSAVRACTYNSPTSLSAPIPLGWVQETQLQVNVQVNSQESSPSLYFDVTPGITGFQPTTGPIGTTVTITGSAFEGTTGVSFGGSAAVKPLSVSATSVTVLVPADATAGSIKVWSNSSAVPSAGIFTPILPSISAFTPAVGVVGTKVTLTVANFTKGMGVTFGGHPATSVTVVSSSTITAVVPSVSGRVAVAIVAGSKSFPSPTLFHVLTIPAKLSVSKLNIEGTPVYFNTPFKVATAVNNSGELPSGAFVVRLLIQTNDSDVHNTVWQSADTTFSTLAGGATQNLEVDVPNPFPSDHLFRMFSEVIVGGQAISSREQDFAVEQKP